MRGTTGGRRPQNEQRASDRSKLMEIPRGLEGLIPSLCRVVVLPGLFSIPVTRSRARTKRSLPGTQHGGGRTMEPQALQDSAVRFPFQRVIQGQ